MVKIEEPVNNHRLDIQSSAPWLSESEGRISISISFKY